MSEEEFVYPRAEPEMSPAAYMLAFQIRQAQNELPPEPPLDLDDVVVLLETHTSFRGW